MTSRILCKDISVCLIRATTLEVVRTANSHRRPTAPDPGAPVEMPRRNAHPRLKYDLGLHEALGRRPFRAVTPRHPHFDKGRLLDTYA